MIFGWAIVGCAGIAAICFLAYLCLLWMTVVKTGTTDGLRDVATAMRAYRLPISGRRR